MTGQRVYGTSFATMPFANAWERDTHFAKHGHKFGSADPLEYEQMADTFMYGPIAEDARECVRPLGIDRLRFGFRTHHLGVSCVSPSFLRTFYVVGTKVVTRHGGETAYFAWDCGRVGAANL